MHSAALFVRLINTFYASKNFHFRAECYAALPFVHLLLDSTFLTISRLATLFMHGLNTVYLCGFGYVILCFRFTALSVQPLLTAPFLGGVSNALGISDYARFFMELGFFPYCYCCLIYRILSLIQFQFLLWLRWAC